MGKRLPEQLTRLAIVVGILAGGALVVRFLILPPTLLDVRFQQAATTGRWAAREIKYAGATACAQCHDEPVSTWKKGYHKTLSCETCHGATARHTGDPSVKPALPKERQFCLLCHAYDPSRPKGFPQVNPVLHNPLKGCTTCHKPHDPVPPEVPRECSACHAQITNIKSVSPHALIGCTTCHTVPPKHKVTPRTIKPTKPETREFCGQCHGRDAPRKDTPKVDLATHGERFTCWQCHYPHMPERP